MKTLFFEGAGCAPRGNVENCRIRTAFVNDEGKKIYLELSGTEYRKTMHESFSKFLNVGFVDYCYEIQNDGEKYRFDIERKNYEYSKNGILEFVNAELKCSFEDIKITDSFYGYRVHKDGGGYNFIENHTFDDERADKARAAFERMDMEIRQKLNSKYTKISLVEIGENKVFARCYASDEEMKKAGLDPKARIFGEEF